MANNAHLATSQPLCSVDGEGNLIANVTNIQGELLQSVVGNQTEDAKFDEESGLISHSRVEEAKPCCRSGSCCSDIFVSGKLFRLITKATGLWDPRKKRYALLCAIFVALNTLSILEEVSILSICGPFVDGCVTHTRPVANVTNARKAVAIFTQSYLSVFSFSDTATCILLICTLWRAQRHFPLLSLASAQTMVNSWDWLFINIMFILCSLAVTIGCGFRISVVQYRKLKFYSMYGLGISITYLTALTCCCVFAVLTCALCNLADVCFEEICNMGEGNTNDVTAMHKTLCKQLSTFSQVLKPWFVTHWCLFGANCLALFAFDSTHFSLLSQQLSRAPAVFMVIAFVLNFTFFLMPCVYASRVTWKCQDLLSKINNMDSGDWKEGHPFRELANVNEFIFYAERSMCGFKVGSITFGSSGTWFSVFLGLLGLGVRLLEYIK